MRPLEERKEWRRRSLKHRQKKGLKVGEGRWVACDQLGILVRKKSIMERIEIDLVTGCWNWNGPLGPTGYPVRISWKGRYVGVSRLFAYLFLGFSLDERYVLHHCDNRACLNPKHLYIGTQLENMRDASRRGRLQNRRKK